jgi:hypothetical protein
MEEKMRPGASTKTIPVTVNPGAPNGNEVPCKITGPSEYVANDAIFLPPGFDYEIEFTLAGNDFDWADDPFWCQEGQCPTEPTGGKIKFKNKAGNKITATASATNDKALSFYRLNFNDDFRCDPIIINT